ncbi:STAS domain-containing protein [Streptomyces sp. NPDC059740]|uniref:STAS domain-containing protein n=1 Tax=Streptomyces sp. NPDC059740 TaxID=3346926 RepID=UPI00365A353B
MASSYPTPQDGAGDVVAGRYMRERACVVALRGEIDIECEEDVRHALDTACTSADRVVVDLSEVTFADSTALGLLLHARTRSDLRLAGPLAPAVARLLSISGTTGFLPARRSVEEALAAPT